MLPLLSGIVHPFEEQSPVWGLSLYLHMGRPGPSSRKSELTVHTYRYMYIPQYTQYIYMYTMYLYTAVYCVPMYLLYLTLYLHCIWT